MHVGDLVRLNTVNADGPIGIVLGSELLDVGVAMDQTVHTVMWSGTNVDVQVLDYQWCNQLVRVIQLD